MTGTESAPSHPRLARIRLVLKAHWMRVIELEAQIRQRRYEGLDGVGGDEVRIDGSPDEIDSYGLHGRVHGMVRRIVPRSVVSLALVWLRFAAVLCPPILGIPSVDWQAPAVLVAKLIVDSHIRGVCRNKTDMQKEGKE